MSKFTVVSLVSIKGIDVISEALAILACLQFVIPVLLLLRVSILRGYS